jgi:hypothetical protein
MAKIFKGIFANNDNNVGTDNEGTDNKIDGLQSYQEFVLVDRHKEGRVKAQAHNGSETGLLTCIRCIYENHKEILRIDEIEQETAKRPYRIRLEEYRSQNTQYQSRFDRIKDTDIPRVRAKIEELSEDIREIRRNPQEYTEDKVSKAGFVIGATILFFLTIYLFIFYSSASYSTFFKEFTINSIGVVNSIFDAQALSKALTDGFTELILIVTIPFVFLGLGYLIHKFQEEKGWTKFPKIFMLIIVTFIFDAILAYEITEKIYNIKKENSFDLMAPYDFSMAFHSVNFWLIIFAGFIVYIIWGFAFNFVMEAYGKLDIINVLIKAKKEVIQNRETELTNFDEALNSLTEQIGNNNTEIIKMETILANSDIIKPKELENSIQQFFNGWLEYLTFINRSENEKRNAANVVSEFINRNIKPREIINI